MADDERQTAIALEHTMPQLANSFRRKLTAFRAGLSFAIVAFAQFLSPAAAAEPASRIDPPAWSYRHTQEEVQAYGARASMQVSEKKANTVIREARLRRILKQRQQ